MTRDTLFYDTEIAKLIPDKYGDKDPRYRYCGGWGDFENMGIACIGVYTAKTGYKVFLENQLDQFQTLVDSCDEIVGFNSLSFDDRLMAANGINVTTTYDLLSETWVAAGMPAQYTYGVTRAGYKLENLAKTNLGRGKSGSGELAPKLWQDGRREEVIKYRLNDVRLLIELYGRRSHIIDPTNGKVLFLRGGNRLKWLAFKLKRLWKHSNLRVFLWAITHSDISNCRISVQMPIKILNTKNYDGYYLGLKFNMPSIKIQIPSKIYSDFNSSHTDSLVNDPDAIPF